MLKQIITFHGRFSFIHDLSNGRFSIVIRAYDFFMRCSHWSSEYFSQLLGVAIRCHSDQDHVCKEPQVDSGRKMLKRDFCSLLCFSLVVGTTESNEALWDHLDEELPSFAQGTTNMLTNLWTLSDHLRMPWIVISWMWSLVAWASHHPRRCGFFGSETVPVVQWLGICGRCWKGF